MNDFLITLGELIQNNFWIAPVISLFAGIITSFTPCSLASVPLVIGYVGNKNNTDTTKAFKLSCTFALGTAITYTLFGVIASLAGKMLAITGNWWYIVIGILLIVMALQFMELINILPQNMNLVSKNKKKGYLGALIAGLLAGIFSSPCSTPVLIVLLALVSQSGNIIFGILLLLLYSLGHSILIIISGTSVNFVQKISSSEKYNKFNLIIKIIFGILMIILGYYLINLGL